MNESWEARLRKAYSDAATERERERAAGRLGVALAQAGRLFDATELLDVLRRTPHQTRSNWASIYILLLEGLISYYTDRNPSSIDRIRRARALSAAVGDRSLEVEISVWQSMISYNFDEYETLEDSLKFSLNNTDHLSPSLKARVSAQIGDLLQVTGRFSNASDWYTVARKLSRSVHDHALMAAIEYNRLAAGLTRFRYDEILNQSTLSSMNRSWKIEYESVKSIQHGFQNDALSDLLDVCDARYKHACKQDLEAAAILRRLRERGGANLTGSSALALDAEIAWYAARGGEQGDDIASLIGKVESGRFNLTADDVELVFFLRELLQCISGGPSKYDFSQLMSEATANLNNHLSSLSACIEQLSAFERIPERLLEDSR